MKLVKSDVLFNELEHTYTLDGKELSGITSVLSRQLFRDKYAGINESVLAKAAQYGSSVHQAIEINDSLGIDSNDKQYKAYKKLLESAGLKRFDNEYLVSDNTNYASCIDLVLEDCSLADIKTTSHLDMEYLSWQLSIYAYLFELQNPELSANKLYAIWLPKARYGKPAIKEVTRISPEEIKKLLDCDASGIQYSLPVVENNHELITIQAINEVISIEQQLKELEEKRKRMSEGLLELMGKNNIDKFECNGLRLTRKQASTRKSFDSTRFKSEHEDLYESYTKESQIKESLTISLI